MSYVTFTPTGDRVQEINPYERAQTTLAALGPFTYELARFARSKNNLPLRVIEHMV